MRNLLLLLALAAVVASVGGCCSVGLGSCQTRDKLVFVGADDLNSCAGEQSRPVSVRIYYLKDTRDFENALFDAIWWREDETLADSRLGTTREERVFPGRPTQVELDRSTGAVAIGVVANFCGELSGRCWRKTLTLADGGLESEITLEQTCMTAR